MNDFKQIRQIADNPYRYAEQWKKESAKKIIGYFCSYTPEELIYAAGALPFRIFGGKENITLADAHLQAYCCSLARGGLEEALAGKLNFLDGTVFPHTCDTIQRLSDIWRLNAGFPLHFDVILPAKLNTQSAHDYVVDILYKFRRDVEQGLEVELTDEKLRVTINLYNKIRKALAEIYNLRSEHPEILWGSDVYAILNAAMVMDRAALLPQLTSIVALLKEKKESTEKIHKKRIMLTGGICNNSNIYFILEDSGGVIIWDELCTGTRYFDGEIDENSDPIQAIAQRYIDRAPCPIKHTAITYQGENLVKLAKDHKAEGVIFLFLKFCDPHAFDYPYLKESLNKEGIPNILLEIEEQLPAEGQLRTRIEAFMEMF